MNIATINLSLISDALGVYTTLDFSRYLLSESTLLDNYRAIHLVNYKERLSPRSFIKARSDEYIDASSLSLPILGRGTRVIKDYLNRERGLGTEDLTLYDIVVVEGFYINIVSEARLYVAGI